MKIEDIIAQIKTWPNPNQTLLLIATLENQRENAMEAWEKWCTNVDFEDTDHASYQLYPMVYRNLMHHNISSNKTIERFKGAYRYNWTYIQQALPKIRTVLTTFAKHNIPVIVFHHLALALYTYEEIGTRKLASIDFLISKGNFTTVVRLLKECGFKPAQPISESTVQQPFASFTSTGAPRLNLYTSLLPEEPEALYWDNTVRQDLQGTAIQTLDPTTQLFYTLIQGVRYKYLHSLLWIVDANILIHRQKIDWERLVTLAKTYQVSLDALVVLTYLKGNFNFTIPQEVIQELLQIEHTSFHEDELLRKTRKPTSLKHYLTVIQSHYARIKGKLFDK